MEVVDWNSIKENYKDSLIIGNGASIAVSDKFDYRSLYDESLKLNLLDKQLNDTFNNFNTTDFEKVLQYLSYAHRINKTFKIDDKILEEAYLNGRHSLIEIIRAVHPKYDDINYEYLINISNFLAQFKKVISLNYDLILYWAMYVGNELSHGNKFKDGFRDPSGEDNAFNDDWQYLENPHKDLDSSTLIFYLHGNITLANKFLDTFEDIEVKIKSGESNHLDTIYEKWQGGNYSPLFICEGEKSYKLRSIKKSTYLNTIYQSVFLNLGKSIAIYGWGLNQQDEYILERLSEIDKVNKIERIAVSVHNNEKDYIHTATSKINKISKDIIIEFYHSNSKNCWNNEE